MSFKVKKIKPKKEYLFIKKLNQIISFLLDKSKKLFNKIKTFTRIENIKRFSRIKKPKNIWIGAILIIIGIFFVNTVAFNIYDFISGISFEKIIFSFGATLETDQYSNTNILVVGTGGETHSSPDLTDSIIVVSIDKNNQISMLSIPRDLHIKESGTTKINEIYYFAKSKYSYRNKLTPEEASDKAMNDLKQYIETLTGMELNYYVKVEFNTLVKLVDIIGGIEIDVEQNIYDTEYPNNNWGYETFRLKKGKHKMDGETALKYSRSRKSTSDFSRSKRQQKVLLGIKDKSLKENILDNPKKLKQIFDVLKGSIDTDLEWDEMITLAKISKKIDANMLISKVIHDNPLVEGGVLYTPERSNYKGAFVLIPYGHKYDLIHKISKIIFNYRELFLETQNIQILNGTKKPGLATNTYSYLNLFGFNITDIDNSILKIDKTVIINNRNKPSITFNALKEVIQGEFLNKDEFIGMYPGYENKDDNSDITIIIGEDFDQLSVKLIY